MLLGRQVRHCRVLIEIRIDAAGDICEVIFESACYLRRPRFSRNSPKASAVTSSSSPLSFR